MAIYDIKRCTIKIKDGTATPKEVTVVVGEGNLTYEEKRTMEYIKDRGVLNDVREGDEEPIDVSLDFTWEEIKSISGDATPTVEEALKQEGPAATWVSSDADPCNPYAVDIEITHDPLCAGTGTSQKKEVTLLSDFRWESLNHDLRNASVAVRGKCNVKRATITRVTNTA